MILRPNLANFLQAFNQFAYPIYQRTLPGRPLVFCVTINLNHRCSRSQAHSVRGLFREMQLGVWFICTQAGFDSYFDSQRQYSVILPMACRNIGYARLAGPGKILLKYLCHSKRWPGRIRVSLAVSKIAKAETGCIVQLAREFEPGITYGLTR